MAKVKVKGHTRSDGTKVKGHTRKQTRLNSRLSGAKASRSRLKGALRKALRTGAEKHDVKALKAMVRKMGLRVGQERKFKTAKRKRR